MKKSTSLFFKEGTSNKEYHIQLIPKGSGWVVNFQYGRVGNVLQTGSKTPSAVSLEQAEKIYNSVVKEKIAKGYSEGTVRNDFSVEMKPRDKKIHILPQLLNVIEDPQEYINDDAWIGQPKIDGERRMVIKDGDKIIGLNKKGTSVQLPDSIINSIKYDCILDGEIIGDKLYVFDILSLNGKDLKSFTAEERIGELQDLKFGKGIEVVNTAYTTRSKQQMFDYLKKNNQEGIVFKRKDSLYTHGRPASFGSALKYKFNKTATFIVSSITRDKRSVGLSLMSGKDKIFMGKVTIPPNYSMPKLDDLVEVRYLYAYKNGSIFQPVFLGLRHDSDLSDATMKQIVYKAEKE